MFWIMCMRAAACVDRAGYRPMGSAVMRYFLVFRSRGMKRCM